MEAREWAKNVLEQEGFCTQERFCSGLADWFVIGGRWSGDLTKAHLDQKRVKKFEKEAFTGKELKPKEIEKLFRKHFPQFSAGKLRPIPNPYVRNEYDELGCEDDAMIVDEQIYDVCLKEFDSRSGDMEHWIDYEGDTCNKEDFVGSKWCVVIDYHA